MSGLHVPLDVEYAADDKIMDAGPMAELLFIRGLAFCKRTMKDGLITDRQLGAVGLGIPALKKHAQQLVDVGLWTRGKDGWSVVNWLKYNPPAADIETAREMSKENGIRGNHERWHLDDDGTLIKPSPKCPLCRATRKPRPPTRPPDGVGDGVAEETRLPKQNRTEPEALTEPLTLTLKEPIAESLTSLRAANGEQREIGAVIHELADRFRA